MLDIVVTHYDEPWKTGRKFFDMLGCQRGVKFGDIRVILVHDGVAAFPASYFRRYPYRVEQHEIPHGGVSRARNYGMDKASATWIEFCDFDDMYANAYALQGIMSMMDRDVDYMWTPFITECDRNGEQVFRIRNEENVVWIHGKYFRLSWLRENDLRFPEHLYYSEDSAFCAMVNELAKQGRRGKIKMDFPAYSWTYRPDSVTTNPKNEERNLVGFLDRNFWVVEEFKRRGIPHVLMTARMFVDAYYAFHKANRYPEHEKEFAERARPYLDDLYKNSDRDVGMVMEAAGKQYQGKVDMSEPFTAWVYRIMNERKE